MGLSLLTAFIFTPWLAYRLRPPLKRLQRAARRERRIQGLLARGYRPLLLPLVRHRRLAWGFLAAIVVAFAGALLLPATQLVTANNSLEAPHTIRHFDMDNRVSPGGDGPPWRNYAIAAVAIIGLAALLNFFVGPSPVELSYTGLKQAVREGRVAQVTFEVDRIRGRFHAGKAPTAATGDDDTDETTATGADESRTGAEGDTRPGAAGGDPVDAETNRQTKAGNRADAAGEGSAAAGGAEAGAGAGPALGPRFASTKPQVSDPALLDLLEQHGVRVAAEPAGQGLWGRLLMSLLPWVLILGLFIYISWRMQQRMMG
ncbi:MAG: hypothetical protein PVJ47_10535, partial [Thiohalocapsa sp.]